MATEDVYVKTSLQEIVKTDLNIQALIKDIKECKGPMEYLQELNQSVSEKMIKMKSCLNELEKFAKEQDKETDTLIILRDVENHRKQLSSTQVGLRKANVASQLCIEKEERESLLTGNTELRQRKVTNKEQLAKTSGQITDNLLSISRMLDAQVKASESSNSTLITSSKQVTETNEEFKSMSGHIQNSKKLLTKYGRRELTDKLLIFLALVFFFATVLYIMKKRLFKSGFTSSETV